MNKPEIEVLTEAAHIRLRPGNYIGSTENATHLFSEVFDNSLDEAAAGYCSQINISYHEDHFSVKDNGRGLSQDWNEEFKTYDPILVATKLFSGGKFNKNTYKISVGLNGIGLPAVNYLSDKILILSARNSKGFWVQFQEGIPGEPKIQDIRADEHGTYVIVWPSKKYFNSIKIDPIIVEARARLAATFLQNLKIIVNTIEVKPYTAKDFCPDCDTPIMEVKVSLANGESAYAIFGYDTKSTRTETGRGSVNLLSVNQGSHIRAFEKSVGEAWQRVLDKDTADYLDFRDTLVGLKGFILVNIREPKWNSQTKDNLGGRISEYQSLVDGLTAKIVQALDKLPVTVMKALILKFKDYRSHINQMTSSKFLDEVLRLGEAGDNNINRGIRLDSKLVDCTSVSRRDTELFIVEGDSAGGNLIAKRDRRIHAVLPLRGKTLNVVDRELEVILNNTEIRSLVNAIGCGVRQKENPDRIRYSKIIICSDGDVDGRSIQALLIGALGSLIPKTVRRGLIHIIEAPLFGQWSKDGKFIPVWSQDELSPGLRTSRFKGLGSFNANELAVSILNPSVRRLKRLITEDTRGITRLVGNSGARREMLLERGIIK
jgi:DNA gyrase subunit B